MSEAATARSVGDPAALSGVLQWNIPRGVTGTSHQVYQMHMMVTWVVVIIGLVVFAAVALAIARHRRSRGAVPKPFSGNLWLEVAWTLIPAVILVAMLIPTTKVLLGINRPQAPAIEVRVIGSQWKWHYAYPDLDIAFYSNLKSDSQDASRRPGERGPVTVPNYLRDVDRPLVLPVGESIRLQIGSDDVIHSWWVPSFGLKRDAIPGYLNLVDISIDRPGWYRGQCAELCGVGHAYMPIVVHAVDRVEFEHWVAEEQKRQADARSAAAERPWSMGEAMAQGEKTYEAVCAACHQVNGAGIPGTFPALDGSPKVKGPVADHIRFVVHGSPRNPMMRAFGKEMSDRQLAGVITYERNAWDNKTGDLVTPEQVEAER